MGGVLFTLVSLSFLISCSDEKHSASFEYDTQVTFSLGVEDAIKTRSISDGTGADQLMYAVFDEGGNLVIQKSVKDDVSGLTADNGYDMTISLARGNTYQVVFWAQNSECGAYRVSDDMKVTIDYSGINNDETRDAFFAASEPFTVSKGTRVSVVMHRPFAQLNVGVWEYDMQQAVESGIDISKSRAEIKGVADQINLLNGSVSGNVDVDYGFSNIPDEDLLVDVDGNNKPETYEYLSMSYLLADESASTHAMSFEFTDKSGANKIQFNQGLGSVPIQRNYRTNIIGQILSGEVSFKIKIDPEYQGENINSGGLYYNFSQDTFIKDKAFAFNTNEAVTLTSENNNKVTMENVEFSGRVQFIAMGEYRDGGKYVDFTNELTNVRTKDMVVDHPGITNVKPLDYMAPLVFLRGISVLKDCSFTGTTTTATYYNDGFEAPEDLHEVLVYDCGVPNHCKATFDNCTIDRLYAWSHSQITLNNSKVDYIRCSTHHNSYSVAHLTIGEGTVVDEIFVSSSDTAKRFQDDNGKWHWIDREGNRWAPSLVIKSGARVKRLDMNHRPSLDKYGKLSVIIEEGAIVEEIVNAIDEF